MVTLDWRGPEHWHHLSAPCRFCRRPTHLRDTAGRPAHKVCVEVAADRLAAMRGSAAPRAQIRQSRRGLDDL